MSHRAMRVAESIKNEVGLMLLHRLKDTRIPSERVSVIKVDVSGDLRHATIYVSVLGDDEQKQQALQGLRSAAGYVRSSLGKVLQLRSTPEVHFKLDHSLEEAANIYALLNRISQEQKESAAGDEPAG
ncbi:MAG: 30S ribosome-binding factor RbfA [Candidatus Sericytochromatia bacterium]|nr:30S ribosome-binding factor RbfA [Candidatus Sericytochromatia bacterium]